MPDYSIDSNKNIKSLSTWKTEQFGSGTYNNTGSIENTGTLSVTGDVNIANVSNVLALYTLMEYPGIPMPLVYASLQIDRQSLKIGNHSIIFHISPVDIDFNNSSIYSYRVIFGSTSAYGNYEINISSNATQNVKYIAINSTIKKGTIDIADDGSGSITLSGYNSNEPIFIIVYG